jgi:hypothetical protein
MQDYFINLQFGQQHQSMLNFLTFNLNDHLVNFNSFSPVVDKTISISRSTLHQHKFNQIYNK